MKIGNKETDIHKEHIRDSMVKYWDSKRKPCLQKNGYMTLTIGNKRQYVHRLVMEEHLGRKLLPTEQVHHINNDKTDNRIENLEVINKGEHQRIHSIKAKLGKSRLGVSPTNKASEEIILEIVELRKNGMLLKDICKKVNLSYPTVQKYAKEVK